ncbi:MAG: hypothetical protein H6573_24105 [Lewinellaceae bacterium]|nr:hypothetical protein [Phaeodactylibacter sp.]MCB9350567.1 hypothetical protein [Lewinellaceae bacterium]
MNHPFINTIRPLLWIMVLALIAFSSCQKDNSEPEPINLADLPGADYLGRGYNAFGDFATTDELKSVLINFEQYRKEKVGEKEYKIPEDADVQYMGDNTFQSISGQTIGEFQNMRSASVGLSGDYPYFSGAVTGNFQAVHYRTENYAFIHVSNTVNRWKVSLPHDPNLLRAMLTEEARTALATLPPAQLFNQYGTHLLTSAAIGARADYYVAAEKSATNQLNLAEAAEASFKASLGVIDLNAEPPYQEMVNNLREHAFIGVKVQGGSPSYGQNIFSPGNYQDWIGSVDDHLVISQLSNPSLLPIWELCENGARSKEVEEAFHLYASDFELPAIVTDAKASITEILIKSGTEENPYFYQEPGFKVIPENLNEHTTGDYVYLMYKEGLDIETSISELTTVSGVGSKAPAGWFRIATNLNEGTGSGDPEIYLCYKRAFSENPIRQIRVVKGENTPAPEGFELVKNFYYGNVQNFNHGAGGEYIYLAYSRHESEP